MDTGIIKLADKFAGNSSTTVEEMRAYITGIAEKICEVTGLSVISTADHEHGGACFIGESGSENALLAVANPSNVNFYNAVGFCRTKYGNGYFDPASNYYASTGISLSNITRYPIFMRYAKSVDWLAVGFAAVDSESMANIQAVSFFMDKAVSGTTEELAAFTFYNGSIYASYNTLFENTMENTALFSLPATAPFVPISQDAFVDIYPAGDTALKNTRLFTNRGLYNPWSVITVNGEKYLIIFSQSQRWSIAVKAV